MKKNVLILSASTGTGHNQAGKYLQEYFPGDKYDVNFVDFLEVHRLDINNMIAKAYEKMIVTTPKLFEGICNLTAHSRSVKLQKALDFLNQGNVEILLDSYKPDIVICTHFFPLGAMAWAKLKKKLPLRLFGIVTDYIVHPVWCYTGVDCYFVAHPDLIGQTKGNLTVASGIPVGKKFYGLPPKAPNNIPHILVMSGGLGLGSSETVFRHLKNIPYPIEVTFVAGKNKFLYQQLVKASADFPHKNHIYEFSSNIPELMGGADLLITKSGGLTTSEAIAARLPMVIFDPIPGIETKNARFLARNKVATWVRQEEKLAPTIQKLLFTKPHKLQEMKDACASFYPGNTGETIVKYIEGFDC